jgi:hypothetical protein
MKAPVFFFLSLASTHAFIFDGFAPYPQLKEMADAQTELKFKLKFDIYDRKAKTSPHLLLDGLELGLHSQTAAKGACVGLPGAEGPHPQTSSGARVLTVDQRPYFIGMNGKEHVAVERGGWEIVWKKNAVAGALVCGFDIPNEVRRRSSRLPQTSYIVLRNAEKLTLLPCVVSRHFCPKLTT